MYINTEKLDGFSSDKLLTFYRNAAATDCGAIGHTKGHMNCVEAKRYAAELARREVSVPDYYAAAEQGTFNGPGSL
jgi:hypothetical protein